jgi:hypothetical protein
VDEHGQGKEEERMLLHSPVVSRTFRVTIDIESTIDPESHDLAPYPAEGAHYQQALVQGLLAHPEVLRQLLRACAIDALTPTRQLLEAECGWGRASDQQLLQPIIADLEPAAQSYFTEELEDGASVYHVECYKATVKRFGMIELNEKKVEAARSPLH